VHIHFTLWWKLFQYLLLLVESCNIVDCGGKYFNHLMAFLFNMKLRLG